MFRNACIYINKTLITIFNERDLPDSSINCLLLDKLLTVLNNYTRVILTYTLTSEVIDWCFLINLYRLNILNTSSGDCRYFTLLRKAIIAKQSSQNNFPVTSVSHFQNITYSFTALLCKVLKVTAK